ncbi:TRAP transporter large permease [Pontitalea aquivivens]|uniref:TRAP transporter large permease n=1 Tax=Pontitalea aquivivens TaxID=3388663 RepID=UPI0039710449
MTATLIAFFAALALIFLRIPIGISLAIVGFAGLAFETGVKPAQAGLTALAQHGVMSYSLTVLPLFVLMGNLVAGAGISGNLFRTAQQFIGHRRGGLAMATIVACGAFGAICGSSVATAATMSRVALPSMRDFGYSNRLAAATLAAGGTLGILIPPSIIMVIYAVATQTHIGMLFAGGILPGLLGVLGYILTIKYVSWRNPDATPRGERVGWGQRLSSLRAIWPVVVLFGLVMGGIYSGMFTSTEAAGIGAGGALIFAMFARSLTLSDIARIFVDTAMVTGSMFMILIGASAFVEFVNLTGVHTYLETLVRDSGVPAIGVIFIIVMIYIVLGSVMESMSMILITVPVFFPIVMALGYDPVWFGLVVVIAVEVGLITPPIGINLFVIRSVAPHISYRDIFAGVAPFVVADVIRIAIIALFPAIVLWLPQMMF